MPDFEQNNQNNFLKETIKVKPLNRRKLLRRTILTASMAVIFGLIACFTFLVLQPVISNWLYPEEPPQRVVFPEDQEEMQPEDMLADRTLEATPEPSPVPSTVPGGEMPPLNAGITEEMEQELNERIEDVLNHTSLDLENYKELYGTMAEYVSEVSKSIVTVTVVTYNRDWLNYVQESTDQCSGVIISENNQELLILADYGCLEDAEQIFLTFYDGSVVEARIKQKAETLNLAVLAVDLDALSEQMKEEGFHIAEFGTSNSKNMAGTPVVAVGSPMGISGTVGYGIISSGGNILSMTDRNYKLFLTDINGSRNACGVIFNLQSQVIGIITKQHSVSDMDDMLNMYGITELKRIIEKMSNAASVPYLGIRGTDVTAEINRQLGVPVGAYVTELEFDSPAMHGGIQNGDVIVGVGDKIITSFSNYSNALMQMEPGQTMHLHVMRQVMGEYKEMTFEIMLGEAKE